MDGARLTSASPARQYVYRALDGDGSIVAHVASVQNVANWTKAGVMIRGSLDPSSAQAFMLVSSAKGMAFQRRLTNGASSVGTGGTAATAPRWVKLTRTGAVIRAFESADGVAWTPVGSDTFVMGPSVVVGLAVSSHVNGGLATATFDSVALTRATAPSNAPPTVALTAPSSGAAATAPASIALAATAADSDGTIVKVDFYAGTSLIGTASSAPYAVNWTGVPAGTYSVAAMATDNSGATAMSSARTITVSSPVAAPAGLPAGWGDRDIGGVAIAGAGSFDGTAFTVTGSGVDVWGTSDQFHYAYRPLAGDATIVARVAAVQDVAAWVKAGLMIRETLDAGSAHAFILVSSAKGIAFQRRPAAGGVSVNTAGTSSRAPRWIKLTRAGDLFSAFESPDGVNWTLVGTETIPMGPGGYIGLAVTSHTAQSAAVCAFDHVVIQ
jgi:Big-like domain-containing protein